MEKGGEVNRNRTSEKIRFTKNDFDRLIHDAPDYPFYATKSGGYQDIRYDKTDKLVAWWNIDKEELSIMGAPKKLFEWLHSHSYKTSKYKLEDGGEVAAENTYAAFYKNKQTEVKAPTSYQAQKKAAEFFKAKHPWDVTVDLRELGSGKPVNFELQYSALKKGGTLGKDSRSRKSSKTKSLLAKYK